MRDLRRSAALVLLLLAACRDANDGADAASLVDGGPPPDLVAAPEDLSAVDDLNVGDLVAPLDLTMAVDLTPPVDLAGPPVGAILPSQIVVPIGRTQHFVAPNAVQWQVSEGAAGGTVSASGVYTAPMTPGTYHVEALGGGQKSTATVAVKDYALSIVAGAIGGSGFANAIGTQARWYGPTGIVADGQGGLLVADSGNYVLRKIDLATAGSTTFAGQPRAQAATDGVGPAARFFYPSGLALDSAGGMLYVASVTDGRIRKVVLATQAVTTLTPTIQGVRALALDGAGNLYAVSSTRHTVHKIALATQTTSLLAGADGVTGSVDGAGTDARFRTPWGIAYLGGALYVSDRFNCSIRRVDPVTGDVSTVAGALQQCSGTVVDGNGATARFDYLDALTTDGVGALYVGQPGRLRKLTIPAADVSTLPTGSGFANGRALSYAGGYVYYADDLRHEIGRIDVANGAVNVVSGLARNAGGTNAIGPSARFTSPMRLAVAADGNAYVLDYDGTWLRAVALDTGAVSAVAGAPVYGSLDGTGNIARFGGSGDPLPIAGGKLVIADPASHALREVDLSSLAVSSPYGALGVSGQVDAIGTAARFKYPWGITRLGQAIFVCETSNSVVRRVDLGTGAVSTFSGANPGVPGHVDGAAASARFKQPFSIGTDGVNTLFVHDIGNYAIRAVDATTGAASTLAGGTRGTTDGVGVAAQIDGAGGIAYDGAGGLLFVEPNRHTIRRLHVASGAVDTLFGSDGRGAVWLGSMSAMNLNYPLGIALAANGDLIVSSYAENAILRIAAQ